MVETSGVLWLRAPGMEDLRIESNDLEFDSTREIFSRMIDVDVKVLLCGKVYDQWVSAFLTGKPTILR